MVESNSDDLQEFLTDVSPNMSGGFQDFKSHAADKFHANVKLDVKQYPTFDGELSHWLKFKRNVLALAATHSLMDIFDENYIIPTGQGSNLEIYQAKNQFVYSIWASRVFGFYPLGLICQFENTKDVKGVFTAFLD